MARVECPAAAAAGPQIEWAVQRLGGLAPVFVVRPAGMGLLQRHGHRTLCLCHLADPVSVPSGRPARSAGRGLAGVGAARGDRLGLAAAGTSRLSPGLELAVGCAVGGVRAASAAARLVDGAGRGVWDRGQMAFCRAAWLAARANPRRFFRLCRICQGHSRRVAGASDQRQSIRVRRQLSPHGVCPVCRARFCGRVKQSALERTGREAARGGGTGRGVVCRRRPTHLHPRRIRRPLQPLPTALFAALHSLCRLGLGALGGGWGSVEQQAGAGLGLLFRLVGVDVGGVFRGCVRGKLQRYPQPAGRDGALYRRRVAARRPHRGQRRRRPALLRSPPNRRFGRVDHGRDQCAVAARERVAIRAARSHAAGPAPPVFRHFPQLVQLSRGPLFAAAAPHSRL